MQNKSVIINLLSLFLACSFLFLACHKDKEIKETVYSGDKKINAKKKGGDSKFDIELYGFSFPDSVTIGETISIDGKIKNNGPAAYVGEKLQMQYAVSNDRLTINIPDFVHDFVPPVTVILPGQIINYHQDIIVSQAYFKQNEKNIIIIWPGTLANDSNNNNNKTIHETFVK